MTEPAIVVIAYNRVVPLKRLLNSLSKAVYPSVNITLHISIDASNIPAVAAVAENFEWKHGNKIVDIKKERRGLLKHVLECGDLTAKYDAIVVLEDDLIVSPGFYRFAQEANSFYHQDEQIAGVSLFTYPVEENNFYPFDPIQDDSDVHFIQVASSWGQCWCKEQWSKFKNWLAENPTGRAELLPNYIEQWGSNSWKRLYISYMIDTDRYFVFPNTAYSSNFEEEGTHASNTGLFQVKMQFASRTSVFKALAHSNAVYDAYFELLPRCVKQLCPSLSSYDFEVDLYGEKPLLRDSEFVLTARRSRKAERSFGTQMKPFIQNVLHEIEGESLVLSRKKDLCPSEKNRFLLLNSAPERLGQWAEIKTQKYDQVSLIIPVLNNQVQELAKTMNAFATDRFYNVTLILVCSEEIEFSVQELVNHTFVNIRVILAPSQDVDELLRCGFTQCQTAYCGWLQAGMQIDLKRIEDVARVFQGMAQVQVLHGMQADVNADNQSKVNTSLGRWTLGRAYWRKSEAVRIRTELVFWRISLVSKEWTEQITSGSLFIELLKLNPVYVLALKLGNYRGMPALNPLAVVELQQRLDSAEFRVRKGIGMFVRPIFHYWFRRNVPVFRLFYRELEQLPLVIRYDFKNDSFYLSNT